MRNWLGDLTDLESSSRWPHLLPLQDSDGSFFPQAAAQGRGAHVYKVLGTGLAHSVLVFFNSDDVNDGPVWQ